MVGTHLGPDGIPQEQVEGEDEDEEEEEEMEEVVEGDGDDSDDNDSLSDDEYDPMRSDDREYTPTDTAALAAMNIGFKAGGNQLYFDDEKNMVGEENGGGGEYDSDEEDTNLRPTDVLALCATTDTNDDFSTLEVYVYEPPTGNLYVHHDITLPSFPLCVAWGDVDSGGKAGNFAAVGTFEKGIEVWNLDVLDPLEPAFTLGGVDNTLTESMASAAMVESYNEQRNLSKKEKNKKRADKKMGGGDELKAAWAGGEEKVRRGREGRRSEAMTAYLNTSEP